MSVESLRSVPDFTCGTNADHDLPIVAETTGNSELRVSSNRYIFDWDTDKDWEGTCRRLVIELDSGQTVVADFFFK